MLSYKLGTRDVLAFEHLINEGVVKELKEAGARVYDSESFNDGFAVYGIIQEEAMIPEGALVAQVQGYTACIRSLFVSERYRAFGGGTKLLEALVEDVLGSDDIDEIEFLADNRSEKEKTVVSFLKSKGFLSEAAAERIYLTDLGSIDRAGVLSKFGNKGGAVALRDVDERDLRTLGDGLSKKTTAFLELPINKDAFEQDLSMVTFDGENICDLLLIEKEDRELVLSFAYSGNASGTIMIAFAEAMKRALEKYGPETAIKIPTVNEVSNGLVRKIVPDAKELCFTRCYMPVLPMYEAVYGTKGARI